MKNLWTTITLSTIFLVACGGSGGDSSTGTPEDDIVAKLANTSWEKECFPYNELAEPWNIKIKLKIDSSLKSTYRTEFFHPTDLECDSMAFDYLDISNFNISGRIITEESIAANGLDETFVYNSDNRELPPNYTLIYLASEKLYFGQKSGENNGETPETRHSSISLDHYFSQVIN